MGRNSWIGLPCEAGRKEGIQKITFGCIKRIAEETLKKKGDKRIQGKEMHAKMRMGREKVNSPLCNGNNFV
jgi:hypothetical protein